MPESAEGRPLVTQTSLAADLRGLGVPTGAVLIAHSSLSSLGWVCGGPQTVVLALFDVLGPDGTLVMPSQSTHLTDPASWSNPPVPEAWWAPVREAMPAYDAHLTPTRGMGAVVDCLLRHPAVVRSPHPQVSFAALGPRAMDICASHPLADRLGEPSPLGRLYEMGALILLLGVDHESNTSLHLAESRATWSAKGTERLGAPVVVDGRRVWAEWDDVAGDTDDFNTLGEAFAEQTGLEHRGQVGAATARLLPMRELVDYAVAWMGEHRR